MTTRTVAWLPIVSAVSATAAAVLSGYISISTFQLETSVKREIVVRQAETQRKIADLQEQTKLQLGKTDVSVRRAELFANLIGDLEDPKRSSFAILALWQLYRTDEERRIIIAAALQARRTDAIETLILLGEQLDPEVLQIIGRASRSEDEDTRTVATNLLVANQELRAFSILRRFFMPDGIVVNAENTTMLKGWMPSNGIDTSIPFFLNAERYADLRRKAVNELELSGAQTELILDVPENAVKNIVNNFLATGFVVETIAQPDGKWTIRATIVED